MGLILIPGNQCQSQAQQRGLEQGYHGLPPLRDFCCRPRSHSFSRSKKVYPSKIQNYFFKFLMNFRDAKLYTSILPIRSVGVQGDCRSYSQVACISGPPLWSELVFLAKLIPRICHAEFEVFAVTPVFQK